MNIYEMRDYISKAYPGEKWKARCRSMSKNQVIAIYHSLMNRKEPKHTSQVHTNKGGIQMTIFDYL